MNQKKLQNKTNTSEYENKKKNKYTTNNKWNEST
jgi:hypothetical protein